VSEHASTSTDVPPTPTERAEVADIERDRQPVVPDDAPPATAAAAAISDATVNADVVDVADTTAPTEPVRMTITPGGEVEVECPGCGTILVGESPRPTAAWFCPTCDFPAFWASPPAPEPTPQRRARRRLPGTSGTEVVGAVACWSCGERNGPEVTACIRCAATLPKPTAPEPEPVVVQVATPVPVPYLVRSITWPYVAAGTLGGAAVAIAVTAWSLGAGG
jgi:hypothetical protein